MKLFPFPTLIVGAALLFFASAVNCQNATSAPKAAPSVPTISIAGFKTISSDDQGTEPTALGYTTRAAGGLTLYTTLPDGAAVTVWVLDSTGKPVQLVEIATVQGNKVSVLDSPIAGTMSLGWTQTFQLDTIGPSGLDVLGRGVLAIDNDGGLDLPATGGDGSPSASLPGGVGTIGDDTTGGFSFKCNKPSGCRLKIVLANGVEINDKLEKDDTAFVPASGILYAVCSCD